MAKEIINIEPLFEYPTAPDDLESISDRCNYIVKNFWNKFDFKQKTSVDQNALNHAFNVYITAVSMADYKIALSEIDNLNNLLSKNVLLLLQFTKAAEENLYGPRADFWQDELYLKFLDNFLNNKKITSDRKKKYLEQYTTIKNSLREAPMPRFSFISTEGREEKYFPMSTPTMIIFGDPSNIDWRIARMRMETNQNLLTAINKGKVNIIYIVDVEDSNWGKTVDNYSSNWKVGYNSNIKKEIDIRLDPTIYVVGQDGKILQKNDNLENSIESLLDEINP